MPENEINIRVTTDGAKTLGEIQTQLKNLKTAYKDAVQGTPEAEALKTQINQVSAAAKAMNPNFTAMSQHIREARMEKRLLTFAAVELTQGITGVTTSLVALVGGSEKTSEQVKSITGGFTSALSAGMGLKFALDLIGGSFAKFSGPIAIAVGGITLLGAIATANKKQVQELNKSIEDNTELLLKLGRITEEQYIKMLGLQKNAAEKESATGPGFFNLLFASLTGGTTGMVNTALQDIYDTQNKTLQIESKITDEKKKQKDEQQKQIAEQQKQSLEEKRLREESLSRATYQAQLLVELGSGSQAAVVAAIQKQLKNETDINRQLELRIKLNSAIQAQYVEESEKMTRNALTPLPSTSIPGMSTGGKIATPGMVKVGRAGIPEVQVSFAEALQAEYVFQNSFTAGVNSMANEISMKIGTAFANMFGGAKTMLGSFVGAFMDALSNIAAQVAAAGILNAIFPSLGLMGGFHFAGGGMIEEPVIGRGLKSGKSYTFGEMGSEMVTPISRMGQSSGTSNAMRSYVTVTPIVGYKELAVKVEVGNRMNSQIRT